MPTPNDLAAAAGVPAIAGDRGRVFDAPQPWRLMETEDGDGMTLEAVAVPYDTPTRVGSFLEEIAPGSVDIAALGSVPLLYRHAEPIGRVIEATDTAAGPMIRARLSDTALGRDVATLIRDGAVAGVSIGFDSLQRDTSTGTRVRHEEIRVREISVTPLPAYSDAKITALREEVRMTATTEPAPVAAPAPAVDVAASTFTATETDPAEIREISERVRTLETAAAGAGVHPLQHYRSLTDYARAVLAGTETRALVDQTTPNNPGVVPPAWIKDVKGIVDGGRPAIEGIGGATALPGAGMAVDWPYYAGDLSTLIGVQATEKTEITSARVDLLRGTSPIKTYAGGSDISRQLIDRSDPSYVDAYLRIMFAAYARITDKAFTDALFAGGTGVNITDPTDAAVLRAWLAEASMRVADATGSPATVAVVGKAVYLAAVADPIPLATYLADAALPRIVFDPNLGDLDAIVTNGAACGWLEDGPNTVSDDVVDRLGRDVAVYGYAAPAVYTPAGVIYDTAV